MVNVAEKTLNEVDVVLWLVEPSNFIGAGEQHIIEKTAAGEHAGHTDHQQSRYGR